MLSKRKEYQNEIYEICQKSGDVSINDRFRGVQFSESALYDKFYAEKPCVCIGKIGGSERVFLTDDKLCYFSVTDGWGKKDGYLVALNQGFVFRLDTPMELEDLKEFVADPPEAHGFAANMKRCAEIRIAKTIISILEKSSESI